MLKINRQTDHAIRVIPALVKRSEGIKLSSNEALDEMLIPNSFMTRIVARFSRVGLVNTFSGHDGRLMLPCTAVCITLMDVCNGNIQMAMMRERTTITFDGPAQEAAEIPWIVLSYV